MNFSNKLMLKDWNWVTPMTDFFESRQQQARLQEKLTITEKVHRKTQIRNIHEMEKRTELKNYELKNFQYKNERRS